MITGTDIRHAVQAALAAGMRDALDGIGARYGFDPGVLLDLDIVPGLDAESFIEDPLPVGVIIAGGVVEGSVEMSGAGRMSASWRIDVLTVVSSTTRDETIMLAELYAAAVRQVLLADQSLGGLGAGTEWVDEAYDELGTEDSRTIAASRVGVEIRVADALGEPPGVDEPPTGIVIGHHETVYPVPVSS